MKFADMKYERPDFDAVSASYSALLDELEQANDPASFLETFKKIEELKCTLETMSTLSSIRHSIDTKDAFYDAENEYWDEHGPLYEVYSSRLSRIAVECPFKEDLYASIPKTWFQMAECQPHIRNTLQKKLFLQSILVHFLRESTS